MTRMTQDEWKKVQERSCKKCVHSDKTSGAYTFWECTRLKDRPLISFVSPVSGYTELFQPMCLREREHPTEASSTRGYDPVEHERCGWEGKFFSLKA